MNKVFIKGRISQEINIRNLQNDKAVVNFNVAVNEKDKTNFFTCVAWNKQAEFISKYFKKGQEILIEGRLETRKYEEKTYTEIIVEQVEFCGSKINEDETRGNFMEKTRNDIANLKNDDCLPF